MKRFLIYALRWQLSGFVLAPCIYLLSFNPILAACIGNLLGACIFWWVDKIIFGSRKVEVK